MNYQTGKNGTGADAREARGEWLSAFSLVVFFISTTVLDARIMTTQIPLFRAIFLPGLIFCQGYVIWYYFNKFRPMRKLFTNYSHEIVNSYSSLFVMAMASTSVVALVGFYVL